MALIFPCLTTPIFFFTSVYPNFCLFFFLFPTPCTFPFEPPHCSLPNPRHCKAMASSSAVPPATSVWVVVHIPHVKKFITTCIEPVPQDMDGLKEAVKRKLEPTLNYCAAGLLEVWKASATKPDKQPEAKPLEAEAGLEHGPYYWVEAPANPSAPGWSRPSSSHELLCL